MVVKELATHYARDSTNTTVAHAGALTVTLADCFSYQLLIARKLPFKYYGKPVAWVSTQKISVTTNKHRAFVRRALFNAGYFLFFSDDPPLDQDETHVMRLCDLRDKELARDAKLVC